MVYIKDNIWYLHSLLDTVSFLAISQVVCFNLLMFISRLAVVNPEKISVVPTKTAQTVKTDLPTQFPDETSTKIPLYKTTSITGKIKHSSNVISDLKIVFASTTTSSAFLPTKTIPTVNATKR